MVTATATRDAKGRFKATPHKRSKPASNGNTHGNGHESRHYGALAGAAAGGAALGLLALLTRKAVVQAPTALAGAWPDALAAEHAAVRKLFDAIEATDETSTTKRGYLLMQLKHALAKHAVEEENVIYPALREAGQIEAADELYREHGYVKQFLYELENMPSASPEWIEKVRRFRADIEDHMEEEELHIFPMLRAQLSEEKNKALTHAMNREGFKVA